MARHRKSKGGRPRKAGARYPGGKLIPQRIEPNARVVQERASLLGSPDNLELASDPLGVMLAREWITERQHKAGVAFARIHAQAQLGGPRVGNGDLSALAPSAVLTTYDKRAVREWSDEELTQVFDQIFNRLPRLDGDQRAQNALSQLNMLCMLMTAAERSAVLGVCTRAEWPAWLEWRVGRSTLRATNDPAKIQAQARTVEAWDRQRVHLVNGLDRIAAALFVKVKADAAGAAEQRSFGEMNAAPPAVRLVEETTDYVTAHGELLYTAVRRRRAAG